eukprot:1349612-Amphidinium_carterae.1
MPYTRLQQRAKSPNDFATDITLDKASHGSLLANPACRHNGHLTQKSPILSVTRHMGDKTPHTHTPVGDKRNT